jgi:aminoglycoside phosphotransferase family enzyme
VSTHANPPDRDGLAAKVAFLSRPRSYPDDGDRVETIETHYSWVFLTARHAYKLKKPVHDGFGDLRSVEARRRNCEEELRVNRRFSPDVYLGVVPLSRDLHGALVLGDGGRTVDWLVRMRRLETGRALDRIVVRGDLEDRMLGPIVELICGVYARCPSPMADAAYRAHLRRFVDDNERELARPSFGLPVAPVRQLCADQRALLDSRLLHGRASRLVEGHGDLRPEHVVLETPPVVIDSLELSRELRIADPVDELGFLALECERLGAPAARALILREYARTTGDAAPDALVHVYQSLRAGVRARLAIRHLLGPPAAGHARWSGAARRYLCLARQHADCATLCRRVEPSPVALP